MAKYRLTGTVTVSCVAHVEADSEEEAKEIAGRYGIEHESMVRGLRDRSEVDSWIVDEFDGEVTIEEAVKE